MAKIRVMMSYPDIMRKKILEKGMDWWAQGGEYDSFAEAIDVAKVKAEEMNFPIQLKAMGQKMTVYPKSIGY